MFAGSFRTAWRFLSRRPSLAVVATLTLALGIGANTAMFSIVRAVLLDPLPFGEPQRLVSIWPEGALPRGDYQLLDLRSKSYAQLAGHGEVYRASLVGDGEPLRLDAVAVTASFFDVLGVPPRAGRTFAADMSEPGQDKVVVIGSELFDSRFGGDEAIIGRTIQLDDVDRVVIGVAPAALRFPARSVQAWVPAVLDAADWQNQWTASYLHPIGRLAEAVSVESASRELGALMPELRDAFPWDMPSSWGTGATVISLRDAIVGDVRPALRLLFAAVGLVLLIACVNVANLLLAHHRGRTREMALRSALGGGRWAILRQLLAESLSLAALGGFAGLFLGWITLEALRQGLPVGMPRLDEISLDGGVLAFTVGLSTLAGLVMGLWPAWRASNPNLSGTLRDGSAGAGTSREHRRTAALLVVAQVMATLVLVIGAGLLIRSFAEQLDEPTGFTTRGVLTAAIAPPTSRFDSGEKQALFYDQLTDRLEALPGVRRAAVASQIPFDRALYGGVFVIDGRPTPSGGEDWPIASGLFSVSDGFFDTIGLDIERGRAFESGDGADSQLVVIVSGSLAERYWPGQDAIGERIAFPGEPEKMRTIVGIARDAKLRQLTDQSTTALYVPMSQQARSSVSIVMDTNEPSSMAAAVRREVAALDAQTPVSQIRTFEQMVATSLDQPRFTMSLLGAFAGLALLLAMVGLYGVLSYSVAQRKQEMAIRMSLGAEPSNLLSLIVKQGVLLAGLGLLLGLPAAMAASKLLQSQLFGVGLLDPWTYAIAASVLALSAVASSWLPAYRASRVDAMTLLRSE